MFQALRTHPASSRAQLGLSAQRHLERCTPRFRSGRHQDSNNDCVELWHTDAQHVLAGSSPGEAKPAGFVCYERLQSMIPRVQYLDKGAVQHFSVVIENLSAEALRLNTGNVLRDHR